MVEDSKGLKEEMVDLLTEIDVLYSCYLQNLVEVLVLVHKIEVILSKKDGEEEEEELEEEEEE